MFRVDACNYTTDAELIRSATLKFPHPIDLRTGEPAVTDTCIKQTPVLSGHSQLSQCFFFYEWTDFY